MPTRPSGSPPHRRLLMTAILCVLCLKASAVPVAAADTGAGLDAVEPEKPTVTSTFRSSVSQQEASPLPADEVVRRSMAAGEEHRFSVVLARGQFMRAVAEQRGMDVTLRIEGPDKKTVAEMDSPNGFYGPESASVIAQSSGEHLIVVRCDQVIPEGLYELRRDAAREPTEADHDRVVAERLFNEGQELRRKGGQVAWEQAAEKYQASLAIWEKLGDVHGRAYTVCNLGRVYRSLCRITDALDRLERAASILKEAGDASGQAWVLNEIGFTHRLYGNPSQALKPYDSALKLRRAGGERWGEAQILNNIGLAFANAGAYHQAIEYYRQALPLWEDVGDKQNENRTNNNLILAQSEVGSLSGALEDFLGLLDKYRDDRDAYLRAYAHNNIGRTYDSLAEPQKALEHYNKALEYFQNPNTATEEEAMVLDNIGMVHAGLGDGQGALNFFTRSLAIRERLSCSPRGLGVTLTNIGYAYVLMGEPREALKYFERALLLSREAQNLPFVAYALLSQGIAHASLDEPREALELYGQALDIQVSLGDRRGQAITLDRIGQAQAAAGAAAAALDNYERALRHWAAVGDRQGQALTLYGVARVERDRGHLAEALKRIEGAVEIVESLRTSLTGWQLQLNYFTTKQDFYELNIDVRMRLYELTRSREHLEAALYASERARARSLLELLVEARADASKDIPPQLAQREHALEQEISTLAGRLIRARNLGQAKEVAALEKRFDALTDESYDLQARIRASSKSYADLKHPQPLRLGQIQQLLDDDTLLLEYALGQKHSYVWAVTSNSAHGYRLPGRALLEKAVKELRSLLTAHEPPPPGERDEAYLARLLKSARQYRGRAAALSEMILGRVAGHLKVKRLVLVADGALLYLPFEALPAPSRSAAARASGARGTAESAPLVASHEVVYEPSATALALLRETPRARLGGSVAVLADPVFDASDQRVAAGAKAVRLPDELGRALRDVGETGGAGDAFKLRRLRHSAVEAESIVMAAPAGSWMKAVGFKANRATATSPELRGFGIVHFATHGILDDKHPELSGVVLSLVNESGQPENGFLRLGDIYKLTLPVDLVVLSACQTGLGKEVKGEGLVGLTRGFMHAGAARVVASLWKVDDEATAELMKHFYRHMLGGRMPVASALRQAKLDMMQAREQWREPYYWAGFVLQGDWK